MPVKEHSQFSLLAKRRFGFFYITQLLGAFNDNVFKNALIIMITYQISQQDSDVNTLVNLSAGLFILPFFLFSGTAGQLADKFEKSALMPEFHMRFLICLLIHSIYRVKKDGLKNISDEGAAILVCNNVSFVDALMSLANMEKAVREMKRTD